MEREHMRVHEENKTEAGKVRWVRPDGPDDVGGPVGQRWGRPDKDGDGWTKMGTNPDTDKMGNTQFMTLCCIIIFPWLHYCAY